MTTSSDLRRPAPLVTPPRRPRRQPIAWLLLSATALLAVIASAVVVIVGVRALHGSDADRHYLARSGWPSEGQAAYRIGSATVIGPGQEPAPIASLAKVMTARVVLRHLPLRPGSDGPTFTITPRDVADTERRRRLDQSLVRVRVGERLTERQALFALMLPSANNIAALLAERVAGSRARFVGEMNAEARALRMTHTRYTDPSGYDRATVSTAADQVLLASAMAGNPTFTAIAATSSARLPVAGTVHNTDTLLGHDGFTGTKTGSDDDAGGCFMFTTYRVLNRQLVAMTGVVLGQPGHNLITAGLTAARQLADRVAPAAHG